MLYRSKKDWWLFGLVWGVALAPLVVGLFLLPAGGGEPVWMLVRTGVIVVAVVLLTSYPLNYEVTSGELIARRGVMRWRVPLSGVREVSRSRNPAGAPAWSLDRLRIEYLEGAETRSLYVSPEDGAGFMRDLADAAPGLEMRGERVVRVP